MRGSTNVGRRIAALTLCFALLAMPAPAERAFSSLQSLLRSSDLIVLGDVRHGVSERVRFFSSESFFASLSRAGVQHVAIEMPRVLGRQAMTIETEDDVEAFAADIIRSGRWRFTDPDHPSDDGNEIQRAVASGLGRQVLYAKRFGIQPIFYDFNNPLGGFATFNDPVYRCLAALTSVTLVRYALNARITKEVRDSAIIRERFSHDDELAAFIEARANEKGGGKLVVIPGYAHAVMPGGLAERLETRLNRRAAVVAVFKDTSEAGRFANFLWEQAALLQVDLSRPPHFYYNIADDTLRAETSPSRFAGIDGARNRQMPSICVQWAHLDLRAVH